MGRVKAIGGIFFRCKDPAAQWHWYQQHPGLNTDDYRINFVWRDADNRVYGLDSLLKSLTDSGVEILGVVTREGFRVELWEPNDTEYEKTLEGVTN
ncbi:MAG: hypothetical protein ACJAX5_003647 [Patiriisocius sp.]|jgi:hypothetical protein